MHYVAVISELVLHESPTMRPPTPPTEEPPTPAPFGAWRGWWSTTEEQPAPARAPWTHTLRVRAHLVPRH